MASFDLPTGGDTRHRREAGGLWQNRDFLLLFSAQVISLLGSGVTTVGLALFAYELAEHTTDRERGRAYAAHFALTRACWLFTYPAVGYAAMAWGAPLTFTLVGLLCLAITAFACFVGRGSLAPHTHHL